MNNLSRRALLAGGLVAPVALSACGKGPDADIVWRLGTNLPISHPLSARMKEAADRIYERSGHRLFIEVYPSSQLGTDADMLAQVRAGAIQMLSISGLIMSILVPQTALSGIGFAFQDRQQLFNAMDGSLGAEIKQALAARHLIATPKVFESGFRQITTSSRPINSPADLAGMKIRVPLGSLWTSMFRSFGAAPTSINFSEVYSALQTRVVEGQENPLAVVDTGKLYEVQHYCALTNHMWDGFWLMQNEEALNKLPGDLRDLVQAEFSAAADLQREDLAVLAETLPKKMQDEGLILNRPDTQIFRQHLRDKGFYAHWREQLGETSWRVLENYVGGLA
ncbi:TRAP transporter substrate-binding protein [Brevundimonas sp.]|jgi:tripartite ATP-independent transporter DctP family solute receptor|uniref:TRAP transporter substrate-binding protein n=1 Tax=Brevundimonas sp. TaxID=1871086 RepID=UPI003D1421F1